MPSCTVTTCGRPDAVGDEHLPDRFGRGDEAVDLTMLPSRKRVALEVKVDAPCRDQRRLRGRPARADPSDSASDAIATPCGSCA